MACWSLGRRLDLTRALPHILACVQYRYDCALVNDRRWAARSGQPPGPARRRNANGSRDVAGAGPMKGPMAEPADEESSLAPFRDRAFAVLWVATAGPCSQRRRANLLRSQSAISARRIITGVDLMKARARSTGTVDVNGARIYARDGAAIKDVDMSLSRRSMKQTW